MIISTITVIFYKLKHFKTLKKSKQKVVNEDINKSFIYNEHQKVILKIIQARTTLVFLSHYFRLNNSHTFKNIMNLFTRACLVTFLFIVSFIFHLI